MSDELKTAIDAAKIGAEKALQYFHGEDDLGVTYKKDGTPVALADPATEKVINDYIVSKYPDANVVGEESGGSRKNKSFWIIDPIDGTRIYTRGIKQWAILISYYTDNNFEIGVCYFPSLDEMYYAQRGKGAFHNGNKINVSNIQPLSKSFINFGNPKYFPNMSTVLDLVKTSIGTRGYETTYADCLVASAHMEASIDPYAQLWDYAAFVPIINEAGGKITNLKGKNLSLNDAGCIMTNGLVHDEIVKIVNRKNN